MDYTGEQLRLALLQAAHSEWLSGVRSVGGEGRIEEYFRDCGWQWALNDAGDGSYSEEARRAHPGLLNWCGLFVGWCGLQIGEHIYDGQCLPVRILPPLANLVLPSTYRSDKRADDPEFWGRAGVDPPDPVPADSLEPGDIICVTTSRGFEYGDHFSIVEEQLGKDIETIEGNAYGLVASPQEKGRGVVRQHRRVSDVRRVLRLGPEHFEEAS